MRSKRRKGGGEGERGGKKRGAEDRGVGRERKRGRSRKEKERRKEKS